MPMPEGSCQYGGTEVAVSMMPLQAPWLAIGGLPGAPVMSRHVGGTLDGAPTSGDFIAGDFVIDQSGAIWVCTAGGCPGEWASSAPVTGEPLASGEAIIPRTGLTGDVPLTLGQMLITYWTAATSGAATTVTTATGAASAVTLTYADIGIYSVADNGDLALLADTGDLSATIWDSTTSVYVSALTAPFTRVAGTRYAVGILAYGTEQGTIAPSLTGNATAGLFAVAPLTAAVSGSGLTALPATVANADITGGGGMVEVIVSP